MPDGGGTTRPKSGRKARKKDNNGRPQTAKEAHEESKLFDGVAARPRREVKSATNAQRRDMDLLNHQRWFLQVRR